LKGNILFLEDLDEYLYHIDRMMLNLRRADLLSGLSGVVIGGMTDMRDNTTPFGKTAEAIIAEHLADYSFPVCFGFPSGHITDNQAWVHGKKIRLVVNDNQPFSLNHY
jgi:muramoyltetrapeptide carboxypeptidase